MSYLYNFSIGYFIGPVSPCAHTLTGGRALDSFMNWIYLFLTFLKKKIPFGFFFFIIIIIMTIQNRPVILVCN